MAAATRRRRQRLRMDPRARMFKALATLALALTGGASLLAWLEPDPVDVAAASARTANPLIWRHLAREAIQKIDSAAASPWRAVEVVAVTDGGPARGATLSATLPPDDLHFLVAEDGRLQALPAWQHQQAADPSERVIRVGVVGRASEHHVASAQWNTLRALLAELAGQTRQSTGPLPVRLETDAQAGGAQAPPLQQHLHALLLKDGFLG